MADIKDTFAISDGGISLNDKLFIFQTNDNPSTVSQGNITEVPQGAFCTNNAGVWYKWGTGNLNFKRVLSTGAIGSGCHIYLSQNQYILQCIDTKVLWNTKYYDYSNEFNSQTSTYIPLQTGLYLINVHYRLDITDIHWYKVYINNVYNKIIGHNNSYELHSSAILELNAGSEITFYIFKYKDSYIVSNNDISYMSITRLII